MLFANVESIAAGSDGLIVLPYFAGERMPIKDPHAKGVIFGLNLTHTRDHIIRAALEGIGYGLAQNLDIMLETGLDLKEITAIGGGTKNPSWMQIMSDMTGLNHRIMEKNEGASYGNAMLAALGTSVKTLDEIKNWNKIIHRFKPNPDNREKYDKGKKLFKRLYEDNKELMHLIGG
jgi:xylulokinase